jgi:methylglutaconyl-CoA hydratase
MHVEPGVAVITLNRPEARNAIGAEMLKQLHGIVLGMRYSEHARVIIVCSTVPGVFCAGADLKVSLNFKDKGLFLIKRAP